jgi:hypothetical protein
MNNNQRKNKINVAVEWPKKPYFNIAELLALNPEFVEITLRVRLAKAIDEEGKVVEIGSMPGGKGRPKKIFAYMPVTSNLLDKAESEGINLVDKAREKFINVVSINNTSNPVPFMVNVVSSPKSVIA